VPIIINFMNDPHQFHSSPSKKHSHVQKKQCYSYQAKPRHKAVASYIKKDKTSEDSVITTRISSMLYYALPRDVFNLPKLNTEAIPMPTV
jgi:hypothetical protein